MRNFSSERNIIENGDGSDVGGPCPVHTLRFTPRQHFCPGRVTLLRRAPEAWRMETELAVFCGHHAMAWNENENAKMRSGERRDCGSASVRFRLGPAWRNGP